MNTNLEIEYKTLISEKQFEKMLHAFPSAKLIRQTNTYFRSKNSAEHKQSIRIRQLDDRYLFTLKIVQEDGILEKELWVKGNREEDLQNEEIIQCFKEYGIEGPFVKEGELTTERHLVLDAYGELCMDRNITSGITDYELEYEVKSDPETGFKRFMEILHEQGIEYIPNKISKHARCIKALTE